jgi:hypothetical protein
MNSRRRIHHLLDSIRDTHSEGFSYFVTPIAAPAASGWSDSRWDLHPLESAALSRRTPDADIGEIQFITQSVVAKEARA